MRRILPILLTALAVASCQGMNGSPTAGGMGVAEASDGLQNAKSEPRTSIRTGQAAAPKPAPTEQPAPDPVEPFRAVSASAEALAATLIIPLPATRDGAAGALEAERDRVDHMIAEGSLTREAGAKRLYRFAAKSGFVKGKPDEMLWQSIIQAYRNLDDRYISFEDAAADINAAFQHRREVK